MDVSQHGIFEQGAMFHHYLEFKCPDKGNRTALKAALRSWRSTPLADGSTVVLAFGRRLWSEINPSGGPDGLRDFTSIVGTNNITAPASQRDLWVWIQGQAIDRNLDCALQLCQQLQGIAELDLEVQGFSYHENRDLIGFVDGTANPKTPPERRDAALVTGTHGGSFVLTQKWVHNLTAFTSLAIHQQEAVVGRTKVDDVELEGDAMPDDSHVSRTDASENGIALKLWRRSAPFGNAREHGLYFVAFACDIRRFDVQLQRMYGVSGDGLHDQLIHYSTAVTGAYWYAPGVIELTKALD